MWLCLHYKLQLSCSGHMPGAAANQMLALEYFLDKTGSHQDFKLTNSCPSRFLISFLFFISVTATFDVTQLSIFVERFCVSCSFCI